MASFFIDRPIFAWVVAFFICLIGLISIPLLAIAQYPIIAPPSISISTSYPGASPENLYNSVTRLIEEELNGASGILNFEIGLRIRWARSRSLPTSCRAPTPLWPRSRCRTASSASRRACRGR